MKMPNDVEDSLLELARRGEPSAAPFLVSCFGETLLGFARAHAPDLSDADREQIVELAIEAGVRAIHRFDPSKGTLRSWFRGQVRFQTLGWRRSTPISGPQPEDLAEPAPEVPLDESVREALQRAIARLGRDDQVILALRSSERLAFKELAHRLDITVSAARQRHHRALGRLRIEVCKEDALKRFHTDQGMENDQ